MDKQEGHRVYDSKKRGQMNMNVTWLGQAGLLFRTEDTTILIDPYLSNSVEKMNSENYRRRPVDERYFKITPDVMIFTHDHQDHYDPETAPRFFEKKDKAMLVLAPTSVWPKARTYGNGHNYVQFDSGTEWTEGHLRFTAVPAVHSDSHAIGVVIEDLREKKRYYVTGDTLYSERVLCEIPHEIYAVFLPVNGVGNNMNQADAARFARCVGAERIIPIHFGMFDEMQPDIFDTEKYVIPEIYKDISLASEVEE